MLRLLLPVAVLMCGCIENPVPMTANDAGVVADSGGSDTGMWSAYDPVLGMPVTGDLLFDDERVMALDPAQLPASADPCREPILVRIAYGIDGDTISVDEIGGTENVHVRLIGINSPEVEHSPTPADCYGPEARDFTRGADGRLAWLSFGDTCLDIYDRTLAFVNFGTGTYDMLQRQLLRRGYARLYTFSDNSTFAEAFEGDEDLADASGAGLWTDCP